MKKAYQTLSIIIPCLEPDSTLVSYVHALIHEGFSSIYLVNDGSGSSYEPIFQQLANLKECTLLTHLKNRGKGAALKTAFTAITQRFPTCQGILTADSDGQHAVEDVCHLADALLEQPQGLLLGGRNFSQPDIPFKSWIGNRLSSLLFFLFNGAWVSDTQTGLRGFGIQLLPLMRSIPGERFEYEMAVLTTCASKKIPIHALSIHTIYLAGNASTHFRPVTDSLKIAQVLLGRIWRFMLSSGLSFLIDTALCWVLLHSLSLLIPWNFLRIGSAVVLARTASMLVNYTINKGYVFQGTSPKAHSLRRYVLLVAANMIVSTLLIYLGHTVLHMDERLAKVLSDTILFVINYQIQRIWVFPTSTQEASRD